MTNKLLEKLFKKFNLKKEDLPNDLTHWKKFTKSIERSFNDHEQNRYLLERSLSISSKEMQKRWSKINELATEHKRTIDSVRRKNDCLKKIVSGALKTEILSEIAEVLSLNIKDAGFFIFSLSYEDNRFESSLIKNLPEKLNGFANIFKNKNESIFKRSPFQKAITYIQNIDQDPLWKKEKHLPITQGFKTCWTYPVTHLKNYSALFIFFSKNKRLPSSKEKEIISWAVQLTALICHEEYQKDQLKRQQMLSLNANKKATLSEMAMAMAHEINNPLSIISGHTQKILNLNKKKSLDPLVLKNSLDIIHKTIFRIDQSIKTLKNYSQDHSAKEKKHVEIGEIIDNTLTLYQEKIKHAGISLSLEIENPQELILCNKIHIEQVLLNLITNSYDAIVSHKDPWIKITTSTQNNCIIIQVTDSGKNLSPSITQQMMTPFFTTKKASKRPGLGLSLSLEIVQDHDGTLVYNKESIHTQFTVSFPLKNPRILFESAS